MAAPYAGLTPDDVAYQRKYAQSLMQQGTDVSPVGHWTQALARALQGGVGGYAMGQAGQAEREGRASGNALLAQALQGGDVKSSIAPMLANPWSADMGGKLAQSYLHNRMEQSSPMAQARLQQLQQQTAQSAAMHPLQLQEAKAALELKQRELANPASKLSIVPEGGTLVSTNPRTGQHQVIAGGGQKTPPGYRPTADGNMEAVPGGPADVKINEKRQQDFASVQHLTQSLDSLQRAANDVLQHKGLGGNFGVSGAFPNIPGGSSADAAALLETLKTKAAFATLQDMRNASKTGGALGAVSDREHAMLQNSIAALGKAQSRGQAKQQLRQLISEVEKSKERIRAAYADHWNNGGAAARQGPPGAPAQPPAGVVQPGAYVWTPDGGLQPQGGR